MGWGTHAFAPLSFQATSYSGIFTLLPLLAGLGRENHGAILAEATTLGKARAARLPKVSHEDADRH